MMFVFTYNTLLFLKLPITDILSQYCWTLYMRQRYLKRKLLVFFLFQSVYLWNVHVRGGLILIKV